MRCRAEPGGAIPRVLGLAFLALALALWGARAPAADIRVYSDTASSSHQQLVLALLQTLRDQDLAGGVTVNDLGALAAARDFPHDALIVTVGSEAALQAARQGVAGRRHLHALIPRSTLLHLQQHYPDARHGALVLDQPLSRRLTLLRLALPGNRRLGVLTGPWTDDLVPELERLTANGWSLALEPRDEGQKLLSQLRDLLGRSDVLLALPDPEIYQRSTIHNILLTTYRQRVPVMGFSRNTVRAGALLAVYSTPAQIGHQLATLIADFIRDGRLPSGVVFPSDFEVATNPQVARSLNIPLGSDDTLRAALRAAEESESP